MCFSSLAIFSGTNVDIVSQNIDNNNADYVNPISIIYDEIIQVPQVLSSIVAHPFNETEQRLKIDGLMLGLIATDYYITKYVIQDIMESAFNFKYAKLDLIKEFSAPENVLFAGVSTLYLTSLLTQNEKGQRASLMTSKVFLHSYLITHIGLKSIFARQRPNRQLGTLTEPPRTDNPFLVWRFS